MFVSPWNISTFKHKLFPKCFEFFLFCFFTCKLFFLLWSDDNWLTKEGLQWKNDFQAPKVPATSSLAVGPRDKGPIKIYSLANEYKTEMWLSSLYQHTFFLILCSYILFYNLSESLERHLWSPTLHSLFLFPQRKYLSLNGSLNNEPYNLLIETFSLALTM